MGNAAAQRRGLMLNNMYEDNIRPAEPDQARVAAHADIIIYFACRDVDGAYATLSAHGIAASQPKVAILRNETNLCDRSGRVQVVLSVACGLELIHITTYVSVTKS